MALRWLELRNVRNLVATRLELGQGINVFLGANGAGKTSVLEAIHFLAHGTSFRSHDAQTLVNHQAAAAAVVAELDSGLMMSAHVAAGGVQCRMNGQVTVRRAEQVEQLPLVFIGPESSRLVTEGPNQRRRFLDWGAFHVEPRFLLAWRRYQRALKQRNTALRSAQPLKPWDEELVRAAEPLNRYRNEALSRLIPYAQDYVARLCDLDTVSLEYLPGWRSGRNYADVLEVGQEQDRMVGYTRSGPHKADLQIKLGGYAAKEVVSRGQQKLLACALLLAQAALVQSYSPQRCIALIDDLASELDHHHRELVIKLLVALQTQIFVTALDAWPWQPAAADTRVFHVKQGVIDVAR